MNHTQIILQQVPPDFWQNETDPIRTIKPFVEDALAIELRLPKQVNMTRERMRYQLCCKRIQNAVLNMDIGTSKQLLSPAYFDTLRIIAEKYPVDFFRSRLGACFIPPEMVVKAIDDTIRLANQAGFIEDPNITTRLESLGKAREQKNGMVELHQFLVETGDNTLDCPDNNKSASAEHFQSRVGPQSPEMLSDEDHKSFEEILRNKIEQGLQSNEPVNFSNQPHPVITEALHSFVYQKEGKAFESFKVIYMDGTEAESFPVYELIPVGTTVNWDQISPIKASLISMRHLEMDDNVDFSWFRNSKVSTPNPFAETDTYCTNATLEMFQGINNKEPFLLHLFQTGLETAVVGFYRGLVKTLAEFRKNGQGPAIRVVPYYYDRKENSYQAGTPWE